MVRWNTELPSLMPLIAESLRQEKRGESNDEDISKQILALENRPGLYFESNAQQAIYPVILIIKNSPFTDSEINQATAKIAKNGARIKCYGRGRCQ